TGMALDGSRSRMSGTARCRNSPSDGDSLKLASGTADASSLRHPPAEPLSLNPGKLRDAPPLPLDLLARLRARRRLRSSRAGGGRRLQRRANAGTRTPSLRAASRGRRLPRAGLIGLQLRG